MVYDQDTSPLDKVMETCPSLPQALADGVPVPVDPLAVGTELGWRAWVKKDIISFFFLGLIIAFPTMLVSTGANAMFPGVTGAFGVSLSCTAALTAFTTPLFLHHLNLHLRVVISLTASVLGMTSCTLGHGSIGPAIGTCLAGFVYAFSTNAYLAIAAFYDPKTVRAFSSGSGFSVVFGPGVYIALMRGLNNDWRKTYLVCLPFLLVQVMIWWLVLSSEGRRAAERSRQDTKSKQFQRDAESVNVEPSQETEGTPEASGFGPGKTRIGLFLKTILPVYVLPLLVCTMVGIFALFGLAPIFQEKDTFKSAPEGNLSYEISFLLYGSAQFLFSMLSTIRTMSNIWLWALAQCIFVGMSIAQLFHPFFTYYGVWLVFIFFIGGVVGGSVTNTNEKISVDFHNRGEARDVRSFAMSYGGLGNFGGDALGGGLAILAEKMVLRAR